MRAFKAPSKLHAAKNRLASQSHTAYRTVWIVCVKYLFFKPAARSCSCLHQTRNYDIQRSIQFIYCRVSRTVLIVSSIFFFVLAFASACINLCEETLLSFVFSSESKAIEENKRKMKNVVERQLSWFALLMTAFYSLLASCRGEECGQDELIRCTRPLERITNNSQLGFITNKEELNELCPDLEAGMKCITRYTFKCMDAEHRERFNSLYTGINMAIMELCQDGPYQDDFVRHAPCMQKVKAEYELCAKRYQRTTQAIEMRNHTNSEPHEPIKSICCAFQDYLDCSHHTVRRQCGEDTAQFTKAFLDRVSSSLIKMHCQAYAHGECATSSGNRTFKLQTMVPVVLIVLGRYFT